jgi:hypothetical protein
LHQYRGHCDSPSIWKTFRCHRCLLILLTLRTRRNRALIRRLSELQAPLAWAGAASGNSRSSPA